MRGSEKLWDWRMAESEVSTPGSSRVKYLATRMRSDESGCAAPPVPVKASLEREGGDGEEEQPQREWRVVVPSPNEH
jgi:hypothetical protein